MPDQQEQLQPSHREFVTHERSAMPVRVQANADLIDAALALTAWDEKADPMQRQYPRLYEALEAAADAYREAMGDA